MRTNFAIVCLYSAISAMVAVAVCPVAQAQPDRQCYLTTAEVVSCFDLTGSGSAHRDCYLVPIGPRCLDEYPPVPSDGGGRIQLPNGEWGVPLPKEQWPEPGEENLGSTPPSKGEQPATKSDEQHPRRTPPSRDSAFIPQ